MSNLLIVEDRKRSIDDIRTALAAGPHQLLVAKSAENAITLLNAASFDLVICGVHLNNGTVFDLLKFVKSDPARRSVPFVCFCERDSDLAKSVDDTVRTTAMLLGADKYVTQEAFDAEHFRADIEVLLNDSRQQIGGQSDDSALRPTFNPDDTNSSIRP